jgi:hypothetical protein
MAQSEILGLFGATPQQLRNDYRDSNMVSPAQMGAQGLLQQVVSMGGNAGASLGGALGGLLGGKAPGEREATAVDEAMRSSYDPNMTQAQRLTKMAEILAQQPGMGAQAMEALKAAKAAQLQELQMQKTQQDINPPYKDFKVETIGYEDNGRGARVPVRKYITVTRKFNEKTGEYEDMTPQEAEAAASNGGGAPKTTAEKAAAERARRQAAGVYTDPETPPPPSPPPPPAGSRGMTRGFEGQGMINPEGF